MSITCVYTVEKSKKQIKIEEELTFGKLKTLIGFLEHINPAELVLTVGGMPIQEDSQINTKLKGKLLECTVKTGKQEKVLNKTSKQVKRKKVYKLTDFKDPSMKQTYCKVIFTDFSKKSYLFNYIDNWLSINDIPKNYITAEVSGKVLSLIFDSEVFL